MELMELYNQIHNPIDDRGVIEKLIIAYANSSKGSGGLYDKLTKTVKKDYNEGQYYRQDADKFYAMLFNKWKNSIVAITEDEFDELYKRGSYEQDFIKMRNYLINIPDVSTMKEADEIFYGSKGDKELEDALEKYSWKSFGGSSGWIHVCSRYLTAKKEQRPIEEHRLYLNTESLDTYKMTIYLVEKCDKYHLPYYFKFDEFANRDDTIVIYSSTENLTKYVEILQEIKKEHPELVSRIKDPPVLTGKIDGWIGYGSEPEKTPNGEKQSFNQFREKVLENSIGKITKQWIMSHRNHQIPYQGQRMIFQDYIAMKSTEKLLAELEKKYKYYEENDKKAAQHQGIIYNPVVVNDRLGYTLQDIRSPQVRQNIYRILKDRMTNALTQVCNGSYKDMDTITINVRNGKQITFSGYALETIIQELTISISKYDSTFIQAIQTELKNCSKQYGIDSNKFCFDIKAKERMEAIDAQREVQQQFVQKEEPKVKQQENNKHTQAIDMSSLDVQTLPDIINPALMKRRMKLPNGAEISAKQYIQEIVFPQLPKSGIVILDNETVWPVKQFIEECVMFECQEKYNGDFPRYMADRTKHNLGVVSIEKGNQKVEINPVEITNYINPAILEKRVKLPSGGEISAKQYIQEVFAPHIPTNGRIILKNGAEISAIQYIEEALLGIAQKQFNGNFEQILYNTTRNNNGTITADPKQLQLALTQMSNQVDSLKNQHSNNIRR